MSLNDQNQIPPLNPPASSFDHCPHCGQKLSAWQRVLLTVDRALVCKSCWYRILLDPSDDSEHPGK